MSKNSHVAEGTMPITVEEYTTNAAAYGLVDVREAEEVRMGAIKGAIHIPLAELPQRYEELDPSQSYVLYCAVGARGCEAEELLRQKGYTVRNLKGGYRAYQEVMGREQSMVSTAMHDGYTALQTGGRPVKATGTVVEMDVCGLSCPGPIVQVAKKMESLQVGDTLRIRATDPGFAKDVESWCANTGHLYLSGSEEQGMLQVELQKSNGVAPVAEARGKEKTIIVFDGDLDKAMAAFIIANGALAMGNRVNMFFTFWGLNILRKEQHPPVKKDFISRLFGMMMPKGPKKLGLSKMNFGGMGSAMMREVMKRKGVSSLEELIQEAMRNGVKIVACQMSMDVMGITKEELIDGVEFGGVATMLHDSDQSNMNLFI